MQYNIIDKENVYEEIEKRSRFISYSFKVNNEEEVREKINKIKSIHHSAKHHVYAYVLKSYERYSDDGEPTATAGLPILGVIKSLNLTDVLVVVVRYFGGVLLGTSGLRKMYCSGASGVLNISGISKIQLCCELICFCDYKDFKQISNLIESTQGKIKKIDYLDIISINFYVRKELLDIFKDKFKQIIYDENKLKVLSESYQKI